MIPRLLLSVVLACSLIACSSTQSKKNQEAAKTKARQQDMEDMGGDPAFMGFVGRLRKAVAQHDVNTLAPMMTSNFGYRLDPVGEGDGVFQYWDQQNIWPQLQAILNQHFLPKDNFMVSPPAFATAANYHGYRAGIVSANGAWKFAYFVTD